MRRSTAVPRPPRAVARPAPKRPPGGKPTQPGLRLLPPQPPRLKPVVSWPRRLFDRCARLVAPAAARTQRTQEKASQKTHRAMELFLADLVAGALAPEAIDRHLDHIAQACRPLTKTDARQTTEVFRQCLRMQLLALPTEDLNRLRERALQAPAGPTGAVLRLLGRELDAVRQDMQGILTAFDMALLASESNDPASVDDQLSQAKGKAAKLLQNYRLVGPADDPFAQGEALLKSVCARWLEGQAANGPQLGRFFQAMPLTLQASWLAAAPKPTSVDGQDVDRLLKTAVQHTEARRVAALRAACKAADKQPSIATLVELADAWAGLKKHCDTLNRPHAAAGFQDRLAMTSRQASESLDLPNLRLDALADEQLHPLSQALQTLGIPHDSQAFAREIAARQERNQASFTLDLHGAFRHLAAGDLASALTSLRDVDQHFESLVPTHEALTGRRLDVEGRTELAHKLFQQVLEQASPQTRVKAFDTINDEQTRLLAQVLMDMGLRAQGDGATAALSRIGTNLLLLKDALAQPLHKTREVRSLSDEQARQAADLLDLATFAIAHHFTGGLVQRSMEQPPPR